MLDVYLIVDLLVVIALVGLGSVAVLQNRKALLNKTFAFFVTFIGVWIISNYISNDLSNPPAVATFANYFVFSCSLAAVIFLYYFAALIAGSRKAVRLFHYLWAPLTAVCLMSASPLVVQGVKRQGQLYAVTFGPLISVYALVLLAMIVATLLVMFHGARKNIGANKDRMVILTWSFSLALPAVVAMQLILPTTTGWFGLTNIGVTPMLIVVLGLFYSVAKHKLFDLRLIIIRTISYLISLSALVLIYGLATHYIQDFLSSFVRSSFKRDALNAVLIALAAASYSRVKEVFDKITNRLFYRDSYDTQLILDRIGRVIVGNVSTHRIQRGSLEALAAALRPTSLSFLLIDPVRGDEKKTLKRQNWQGADSQDLQHVLRRVSRDIILYDELDDQKDRHVKDIFRQDDINLVVSLVTKEGRIGYLIAGAKRSGNPYTAQDLGLLRVAANELAVALQNAQRFEEIQAFNVTLQEKVTEATRELKQTNKKLVALDEAKDEFISMASHQLRTPLTSIKGYLSMLLEGDLGKVSDPQEKALKEAFGSSQRMVFLIADFLNVSRIKTGKFLIEPKEVDLPEMVREELTQLKEMAEAKDLKLVYEQPGEFPRVMLDDNKMRQVMMNMVDNAIYYTPAGGTITIQLYPTADEIVFKVIDSGIGVPKAEQHKLFTKFYRAGNARKARPDGTGLGLFMAQKIVVEQGGAIIFESEEGKGSTFGFRFPLSKIRLNA